MSTDTLVPDEMTGELMKESQVNFLALNSAEIAAQLTLQDFQSFHEVEPTEYIDDLYELDSKYGTPHLQKFSEVWWIKIILHKLILVRREKVDIPNCPCCKNSKMCPSFIEQ